MVKIESIGFILLSMLLIIGACQESRKNQIGGLHHSGLTTIYAFAQGYNSIESALLVQSQENKNDLVTMNSFVK